MVELARPRESLRNEPLDYKSENSEHILSELQLVSAEDDKNEFALWYPTLDMRNRGFDLTTLQRALGSLIHKVSEDEESAMKAMV